MHLTEKEAQQKWCPFVRYLATFRNPETQKLETAGSYNRGGADSGLERSRCLASECMAWRWQGGGSSSQASTADEMMRREDGTVWFKPVAPDGDGWRQSMHAEKQHGISIWTKDHSDADQILWGSPRKGFCGLSDPKIVRVPYPVKSK